MVTSKAFLSACSQVAFPPALLSCPVAVRSAMSLFNELVVTRCKMRDMDLFTEREF